MSRGKYARKHRREHEKKASQNGHSPLYIEGFKNIDDFINVFRKLDINTQREIFDQLYEVVRREEISPSKGRERFYASKARAYLGKIVELSGCKYENNVSIPLATDEKRLIRMDSHGSISKRKDRSLSFIFDYFLKRAEPEKYSSRMYRLSSSPSWRVFRQFESFRSIEKDVRAYLQKSGIHPDALKAMTVNDFCEVIYRAFKDRDSETAHFLQGGKYTKNGFVKELMKYAGKDLEQYLIERRGLDVRVVKSFCDKMRRYGSTDLSTLVVTERVYTPRILHDLAEKEGINVSKLEPGMPISQQFIDYMVDNDKAMLIAARDEKGRLLSKEGLPNVEAHHNNPVMLRSDTTIAAANYFSNIVLVDDRMHRPFLHRFDRIMRLDEGQTQQLLSRLRIADCNVHVMLGFDGENDVICCNLENTPEARRRKEVDLKYKVNYFEMMRAREDNEKILVRKYRIPAPSSYVAENGVFAQNPKKSKKRNKDSVQGIEKLALDALMKKHGRMI